MDKNSQSLKDLVVDGLGYCCVWVFFEFISKRTGMIAARLGVTERTVRRWKERFRAGEFRCSHCKGCMKGRLYEIKRMRVRFGDREGDRRKG